MLAQEMKNEDNILNTEALLELLPVLEAVPFLLGPLSPQTQLVLDTCTARKVGDGRDHLHAAGWCGLELALADEVDAPFGAQAGFGGPVWWWCWW